MCLKSNRTGVTNNLFQFQTTNWFSWWSPWAWGKKNNHTEQYREVVIVERGFFQLGTAHLVCFFSDMAKSSVIIFKTLSFFMSSWLVIIETVNWHLAHTTYVTRLMLTSVLLVEGLLLLESSFISSQPSFKLLVSFKNVFAIRCYLYTPAEAF